VRIYRALLKRYRALLHRYKALLWRYRIPPRERATTWQSTMWAAYGMRGYTRPFCGDIGLFCRDIGLFRREIGLFCRDVGLFCGNVGYRREREQQLDSQQCGLLTARARPRKILCIIPAQLQLWRGFD